VGKPFELDHLVATLQRHTGFAMPSTVAKDAVPAVVQSHDFAPGDLDRDSAIARVGGNTEVYAKVLQAFAADMGRVPGQLATHLSTGDATQAARELHTLKGLAATVGARHLAQLAAQLEKKVKAGVDAAERADVVDELRSAIAALAVTLEPLLAQTPKSDPTASPTAAQLSTAERAQLHHDLRALAQLLKNSDMVAMEVFATVDKNFGPHFGETIEPLRIAMNSLEFEAAEAHCQKLLEELPQP
jgi:HPt (histidine-containing phosphotransfer) domain-containing protein